MLKLNAGSPSKRRKVASVQSQSHRNAAECPGDAGDQPGAHTFKSEKTCCGQSDQNRNEHILQKADCLNHSAQLIARNVIAGNPPLSVTVVSPREIMPSLRIQNLNSDRCGNDPESEPEHQSERDSFRESH
jgi:hypothetical protein